ncbi:MAG: DUF3810 domain-containing protein [Saccharofermentans sp.]|nr:DUF3810 domain-containing protein [Saccharofermentans sp.]
MKVKKKGKRRIAGRIILIVVLIGLLIAFWLLPNLMTRRAGDFYSSCIFPVIAMFGNNFNSIFHFSITENLVIVGSVSLVALAVYFVVMLFVSGAKGKLGIFLYKSLRTLLAVLVAVTGIYQLMHGLNYRRTRVADLLELDGDHDYEDYAATLDWAYNGMVKARKQMGEDFEGVGHSKESFESNVTYANILIDTVCQKYDIPISNNFVRAKPVALSRYWTYTGIVGVYDPFLGEANINTDYMDPTTFPITICHEILHAKGFASETDCNTLATICCLSSTRADFRYAGYFTIFMDLLSITSEYAVAEGKILPDYFSDPAIYPVYRDINASNLYWQGIAEEVKYIEKIIGFDPDKAGSDVNNAFLEANGQEGGNETYIVPDNVYVDFYTKYIEE